MDAVGWPGFSHNLNHSWQPNLSNALFDAMLPFRRLASGCVNANLHDIPSWENMICIDSFTVWAEVGAPGILGASPSEENLAAAVV